MATNLTGQRFGRLVVLSPSTKVNQYWLCKCDCGEMKETSAQCLRGGSTRSCGCLVREARERMRNRFETQKALRAAVIIQETQIVTTVVITPVKTPGDDVMSIDSGMLGANTAAYGAAMFATLDYLRRNGIKHETMTRGRVVLSYGGERRLMQITADRSRLGRHTSGVYYDAEVGKLFVENTRFRIMNSRNPGSKLDKVVVIESLLQFDRLKVD